MDFEVGEVLRQGVVVVLKLGGPILLLCMVVLFSRRSRRSMTRRWASF